MKSFDNILTLQRIDEQMSNSMVTLYCKTKKGSMIRHCRLDDVGYNTHFSAFYTKTKLENKRNTNITEVIVVVHNPNTTSVHAYRFDIDTIMNYAYCRHLLS